MRAWIAATVVVLVSGCMFDDVRLISKEWYLRGFDFAEQYMAAGGTTAETSVMCERFRDEMKKADFPEGLIFDHMLGCKDAVRVARGEDRVLNY